MTVSELDELKPLPADWILYPGYGKSALSSRLVVAMEVIIGVGKGLEQYSHAAGVAEVEGWQYEAKVPRTGCFPIDTQRIYEIWRVGNPTFEQRLEILKWLKDHEGCWYNFTGLLTADRIRLPNTFYCSQYMGLAYKHVGIKAGDAILTPDSIPDTPGAVMIKRVIPKLHQRHKDVATAK